MTPYAFKIIIKVIFIIIRNVYRIDIKLISFFIKIDEAFSKSTITLMSKFIYKWKIIFCNHFINSIGQIKNIF